MQQKHLLLLGVALVSTLSGAQNALTTEDLFERISPSVWVVRTLDGSGRPLMQGSAVVIGPGRLITNCHVLRQAKSVTVGRENVSYGATLEHPDTERDLCQLRVANFTAPAVAVTPPEELRIGARVYAIGTPRGLETTLSDGLLSGLRRDAQGNLEAIQITVPLSGGSSGGGLFDAQGRLIGITTFGLRESQNLNFALPAAWIAEVPARAQAALQARSAAAVAAVTASPGARVFQYRLLDRRTGLEQPVIYRLERTDGDKLIFNQGTRVESIHGGVVSVSRPIGGEFEQAMPPGGWVGSKPEPGSTWKLNYETNVQDRPARMELTARVHDASPIAVGDRSWPTLRIEFRGFTHRALRGTFEVSGPYLANAWYAPDLKRVVRFEARSQGMNSSLSFYVNEALELVTIRDE